MTDATDQINKVRRTFLQQKLPEIQPIIIEFESSLIVQIVLHVIKNQRKRWASIIMEFALKSYEFH